jgi:cytochrome c-type biogenesis protein CcmH/NrfF
MRWVLLAIAIALAVTIAPANSAAQSAKSSLTDPAHAETFNRVSDKLVCQCGCNMILRVCNHFECPSALPMRAEIERQIRAGVAEEKIIDSFVEEYGLVVLSSPPPTGINLAAWVMPGFAVLVGAFVVMYVVSNMLAKRRARPATAGGPAPDEATMARIEEELKRMDN